MTQEQLEKGQALIHKANDLRSLIQRIGDSTVSVKFTCHAGVVLKDADKKCKAIYLEAARTELALVEQELANL